MSFTLAYILFWIIVFPLLWGLAALEPNRTAKRCVAVTALMLASVATYVVATNQGPVLYDLLYRAVGEHPLTTIPR